MDRLVPYAQILCIAEEELKLEIVFLGISANLLLRALSHLQIQSICSAQSTSTVKKQQLLVSHVEPVLSMEILVQFQASSDSLVSLDTLVKITEVERSL